MHVGIHSEEARLPEGLQLLFMNMSTSGLTALQEAEITEPNSDRKDRCLFSYLLKTLWLYRLSHFDIVMWEDREI